MSETCNHDCGSCSANCASRQQPQSFLEKPNPNSRIRKIIGVVSGKGGVGKSLVTSLLATTMQRRGYQSAVMDADITGPSSPKVFGIHGMAYGNDDGILPAVSSTGIQIMSVNLMLDNEESPVIWRGPILAGMVKQFYGEVIWSDVDFMFVDMPPGTGDVPLTVFQSLPLDGIIVVTSPQELVSMIVAKAVNMANMMDIPVLGVVENMSYLECPDCGKKIEVFGHSKLDEVAAQKGLDILAQLPINPQFASLCDAGRIEDFEGEWMNKAAEKLEGLISE